MKTLPKVSTEMSLHGLAYNMTRLLSIFGTQRLNDSLKRDGRSTPLFSISFERVLPESKTKTPLQ
jgi:hypothetical protein